MRTCTKPHINMSKIQATIDKTSLGSFLLISATFHIEFKLLGLLEKSGKDPESQTWFKKQNSVSLIKLDQEHFQCFKDFKPARFRAAFLANANNWLHLNSVSFKISFCVHKQKRASTFSSSIAVSFFSDSMDFHQSRLWCWSAPNGLSKTETAMDFAMADT